MTDNENILLAYKGALIVDASLSSDILTLWFGDLRKVRISDEGQQCCESRHMSTDDDLSSLVGARLIGAVLKDGPRTGDAYTEHEQQFLEVQTSEGFVTIVNHNEHNGYYGGFNVCVRKAA